MPQPYYYSVDVADPTDMMLGSARAANAIMTVRQQKQDMQDAEAQKIALAEQQRQMQRDLSALSAAPTVEGVAQAMVKYPQLAEQLKKVSDVFGPEEQRKRMKAASDIFAAYTQGHYDQAANIADDYGDAADAQGNPGEAKSFRDMSRVIRLDPTQVAVPLGMMLHAHVGNDSFLKTYGELQKKPLEVEKLTAEASKAGIEAKYADAKAQAEIAHTQAQTASLGTQAEIAKETNRINAMKVQAEKATDALKKKELSLKIAEAEQKRDDAARAKRADFQEGQARIDNMVNTLDKIGQVGGWTLWRATGPVADLAPTILGSTSDFEELVNLANSQAFVNQVPLLRGFGALTEREGDKLQRSLQNLSLRQSGEQFMESVKESTRLLLKARAFLAEKYGIPSSIPDTPAVYPTQEEIDAASKKYGVK